MVTTGNLEIEIKLLIGSFADYLKLLGFLGETDTTRRQVNAFFDTKDALLQKAGWALRVRVDNDHGLVTLKGRTSYERGAALRKEIEAEIGPGEALELISGVGDPMELDLEPIRYLNSELAPGAMALTVRFNNERKSKRFTIGEREYLFDLDKTEFADASVDYELEVELDDRSQVETVEGELEKIFGSLSIPFETQRESKFQRALARIVLS